MIKFSYYNFLETNMEVASQYLFSNSSLALVIAAFIFFITLFMVAKQWISISIVIVLLLFSLISGIVVSEQELLRKTLIGTPSEYTTDIEVRMATFHEQILKAYDNLKGELELQKHKIEALSKEVQELKEKKDPTSL